MEKCVGKSSSEVQHCGGRGYEQWTEAVGEGKTQLRYSWSMKMWLSSLAFFLGKMFPPLSSNTNFSSVTLLSLALPSLWGRLLPWESFCLPCVVFLQIWGRNGLLWIWRRGMILNSREMFVVQDIWLLSKQQFAFAPQINILLFFCSYKFIPVAWSTATHSKCDIVNCVTAWKCVLLSGFNHHGK